MEELELNRYMIDNALVLASSKTYAMERSLVIILPDGETQPLISIIQYQNDRVIFISNRCNYQEYNEDNATILGDVISLTYSFSNI